MRIKNDYIISMIEIYFLIIVSLILCLIVYNINYKEPNIEAFENNHFLRTCPSSYKSIRNSEGDTICCNGNIIGNNCIGEQCKLSGDGTDKIPTCISLVMKLNTEVGKKVCPAALPNYYESSIEKGCTNGPLSETLSGPLNDSQPKCIIYPTDEQNRNSLHSCFNQRSADEVICFGKDCVKELVQPNPKLPVLISVRFTDSTGMVHSAFTRDSMEHYLSVSNPSWKDQGIDLSKNISIAEVAKAYYIDKTTSDIQTLI